MKIGMVAFPDDVERYVAMAVENGFEHIEIDLYSAPQHIERFHGGRVRQLQRMLSQSGISVSLHAPYTMNLAEPLPYFRTCLLKYALRILELGCSLNAGWVCVHLGYAFGLPSLPWLRSEALERACASIERLLRYCERLGIKLAIENLNPLPATGELILLGDNLEELQQLLEKFSSPYLCIVLDAGHANTAEGVTEYITRLGQFIVGIHVHDNDGLSDSHSQLGSGTLPWDEFIEVLKAVSFSGPLNVELFDDEEKLTAKRFLECLLRKHGIRQ
jgi:sugar phosphate isomerase/epimerase